MSWKGDLIKAGIESNGLDVAIVGGHLRLVGRSESPGATAVTALLVNSANDILFATGTTKPTDTETGYAKGCLFIDTDVATGTKALYENQGTNTSCVFNVIGALSAGEITLAEGNVLLGNTGGVAAALSALTTGRILVGDGTTLASVAMSGDASIVASGALTIEAGVIDEAMLAIPTGDVLNAHRIARATYDFAVDGGAISIIGSGVTIPDNAIIVRAWYEVIAASTLTSATDAATISISLPVDDVDGIVAATAISAGGNVWDAGLHEAIQTGTVATMSTKTTAAREISFEIAVEAVTAGKFVVFCEYVVSD